MKYWLGFTHATLLTPALFLALLACGGDDPAENSSGGTGHSGYDAAPDVADAGSDGPADASPDTPVDSPADVQEQDGGIDASDAASEGGASACESTGCSVCHGAKGTTSCAPPIALTGATEPTERGVGAHQRHLSSGPNHPGVPSRPVACSDCHRIPTMNALGDPPHMNGATDVEFSGPVAGTQTVGGSPASFDSATATCSNVYCHRPSVTGGGFNPDPVFNTTGTANCGACHSLPPPAPHPQIAECSKCHGEVMGPGGTWVNPSLHVNGVVNVSGCNACHGDAESNAPPAGLSGETDTMELAVGAHRTHLVDDVGAMGTPHMVFECSQCHHTPAVFGDPAHVDGDGVAEVPFASADGSIAGTGGVTPTWDRNSATCSTYCHGSAAVGASNPTPVWTIPASGQGGIACGSCHALPPTGHYPVTSDSCGRCHGDVVQYNASTSSIEFIGPDLHVNGTVEVKSTCDGCHGGAASNFVASAPPNDLGTPPGTDATDPQVGAHQAHLAQNGAQMSSVSQTKHRIIGCSECHTVPTSVGDPGHLDPAGGAAELSFGPLASLGQSPPPSFDKSDPQNPRCSSTYCHGGLCDGYKPTPKWNGGTAEAMCGSCHGIPPTETRGSDGVCGGTVGMVHSLGLSLTDCAMCHPATMKTTGPNTWEWVNDGDCHMNGKVSTATCDN